MKALSNTKKTRFKIATGLLAFLCCLVAYCVHKELEDVAGKTLTAIMTVGAIYISGDSYRKSDAEKTE